MKRTNTHVWWNILRNHCFSYSYGSVRKIYFVFNHAMMTSSDGNIFRVTGLFCGEFTGHRWIPLTNVSDAELWCFLCDCTNVWVNNRYTGGLRRHYVYCDVTVKARCKKCARALMTTEAHLTEKLPTKIHLRHQGFSNTTSDWLAAALPTNAS